MRSKLRDLKTQVIMLRAGNLHEKANELEKQANGLEADILKEDIVFYINQYIECLEEGNKAEIQAVRKLLHKKQLRLEKVL